MKREVKLLITAVFSVVLVILLAYLSKVYLIPKLPPPLQNGIIWLGVTVVGTIAVLAGVAQITGLSFRDLFSGKEYQKSHQPPQENISGSIILTAGSQGMQNFHGDILQSSTKVEVGELNIISSLAGKSADSIDRLIRDIQAALYGEDKQLPYTLALCLDLCQQVSLSTKYELWLRKELNGYEDHDDFQKSFPDDQAFEDWMRQWAEHRMVKTYIKVGRRSDNTGRYQIEDVEFESLLIGFPVAEIIQKLDSVKITNIHEFPLSLKTLGQGILERLNSTFAEYFPSARIEHIDDVFAYYKSADLNKILNSVRGLVLSLLSEARSTQGR